MVHFRDGDLEALAELVLEALQDVALSLERAHVRQVQLDGADRHPRRRHARQLGGGPQFELRSGHRPTRDEG
jgi:hypothetical protein